MRPLSDSQSFDPSQKLFSAVSSGKSNCQPICSFLFCIQMVYFGINFSVFHKGTNFHLVQIQNQLHEACLKLCCKGYISILLPNELIMN